MAFLPERDPTTRDRAAALREANDSRVIREWMPVVLRWCSRLGSPGIDPEDVAHDVFIVALRHQDHISDENRAGWLFGVTRRVLAQHRRRAWFRRWIPGARVEATDPSGPDRAYTVNETARRVQLALLQLPEREREVLVLCVLEERPDSEVASMLGIPIGTVKSRLRRARAAFLSVASELGLQSLGRGAE